MLTVPQQQRDSTSLALYKTRDLGAFPKNSCLPKEANDMVAFALEGWFTTVLLTNRNTKLVIRIYNLFGGWRYKWKQMCVFYG